MGYQARNLAFGIGLDPKLLRPSGELHRESLPDVRHPDRSLAEINPLVVTKDGRLLALTPSSISTTTPCSVRPTGGPGRPLGDGKSSLEFEARKHHLDYSRLSGNVGAMVNGAGLAMATIYPIKAAGAEPANFLDVGGGASAEMVTNGFRIILGDPNVEGRAHQHLR